jgi:uncharacterized protein YecE (DUF72 family)
VVFEPRHPTWFEAQATELLFAYRLSRVAADPAPVEAAGRPAGWDQLRYFRLHGTPRVYYSEYTDNFIERVAGELRSGAGRCWCIFDNTALGFAAGDALKLQKLLPTG